MDFQTFELKTPSTNASTEEMKEKSFTFIDKMNRLKLRRLISTHVVQQLIELKNSKNSKSLCLCIGSYRIILNQRYNKIYLVLLLISY